MSVRSAPSEQEDPPPPPPNGPYQPLYFTTKISSITLQVTALIEACALGQPAAVEDELRRIEESFGRSALTIELRAMDDWAGSTPLHWAAYSDCGEAINLLLDANADIMMTNRLDDSTALHLTGRYGSTRAASALIAAGALVSACNKLGNTALHECCSPARAVLRGAGAQLRVATDLLKARAPVDIHNRSPFLSENGDSFTRGVTPLLIAAEVGSVNMIRLLLTWGADPFTLSIIYDNESDEPQQYQLVVAAPAAASSAAGAPAASGQSKSRRESLLDKRIQFSAQKPPTRGSGFAAVVAAAASSKLEAECRSASSSGDPPPAVHKAPSEPAPAIDHPARKCMAKKANTWKAISFRARGMAAPKGNARPPPEGRTPVQMALGAGHLLALAELLLGMWRRGGKPHSHADVELLEPQEIAAAVLRLWISKEPLRHETSVMMHAFATIMLSLKHTPFTRTGANDRSMRADSPRNPVLNALKMSVHSRAEAYRLERGGRRQLASRVHGLSSTFQLVALALLDGANVATEEAKAPYSRWNVRKGPTQQGIHPVHAYTVWLQHGTTYAAANRCHIFLADSLVYTHVRSVFLPRFLPPGGLLHQLTFGAANLAWFPALIFMPQRMLVAQIKAQNTMQEGNWWVVWLYPYGGAINRFTSALAFAILLTLRIAPEDTQLHAADYTLLAWTIAIALSIVEEIYYQGWTDWAAEVFNMLEVAILIPLAGMDGCMIRDLIATEPSPTVAQLGRSLQAFATLLAWLRLLRACYYFPFAGPQMLTIQYLIGDLAGLLPLMLFIFVAFTCAFSVLTYGGYDRDDSFFTFFLNMMRQLVGITLNAEPQQLETTFPGADFGTNTGAELSIFLLMCMFGLLVVVLMLSLIVAKFAQSVEYVSKSLDRVYKLKFAQVTYASFIRLQTSAVVPQPLNLLRRLVLLCYATVATLLWLVRPRHKRVRPDIQPHPNAKRKMTRNDDSSRKLGRLFSFSNAAQLVSQGTGAGVTNEVSRFIEAAISEVNLFPESVEAYCQRNEYMLVEEERDLDLLSRVSDSSRAQQMHAKALQAGQERQEEELKRQTLAAQLVAEQLALTEERLQQIESHLLDHQPPHASRIRSYRIGERRRENHIKLRGESIETRGETVEPRGESTDNVNPSSPDAAMLPKWKEAHGSAHDSQVSSRRSSAAGD